MGSGSLNAASVNVNGVPVTAAVGNTTALRAQPTASFATGVWRITDGIAGAPPLFFVPGTKACSVDDGASCVSSIDNKSWLAQFPTQGADLRQWGILMNDTAGGADSVAFQLAVNWMCANGGHLFLPVGTMQLGGATVSCTTAASMSVSLSGAGKDQSVIHVKNNQDGLDVILHDQASSFHFSDFSVTTSGTDAGNAISVTEGQATIAFAGTAAISDLTNVTVRGDDGYCVAHSFNNGFYTDYVSNINFVNDFFVGGRTPATTGANNSNAGLDIAGGGSTSKIGVAYNTTNLQTLCNTYGIYFGAYAQGLVVGSGHVLVGDTNEVYTPGTNVNQITIVGGTMNNYGTGVDVYLGSGGVTQVLISGEFLFVENSSYGIQSLGNNEITATGNDFDGTCSAPGCGVGVSITSMNGTSSIGGDLVGNHFWQVQIGISLTNNVTNFAAKSNFYSSVGTDIINGNQSNFVSVPGTSIAQVTSAAASPTNCLRVTVGSTAQFITGETVIATGNLNNNNNTALSFVSQIGVVDTTHLDLLNIPYSGSSYAPTGATTYVSIISG